MPDGMDGTRREALREALRRRECERGGGGPDFETVRRRVAASPSPLDRRGWTAARSLRLAASLAWHKIAFKDFDKGDAIIRYNVILGYALQEIKKGNWINKHS